MSEIIDQEQNTDYLEYFKDVVLRDVRNESSEEEKKYLHENVAYWLYVLQITRRDVEFQLSSHKSKEKIMMKELKSKNASDEEYLEESKKLDKWKMGAIRFLAAIEKRMLYVKILLKNNNHTEE
jgi:hypothetical protein